MFIQDPSDQGVPRSFGSGSQIGVAEDIITSIGAEGVLFDKSLEVDLTDTPIDITSMEGDFIWLDLSQIGFWTFDTLRITLLLRVTQF